jgi:putative transposase
MIIRENELFHVYNQGNNKTQLFFDDEDYATFILFYRKYVSPKCETLAYCLMPNHFHFLVYANAISATALKLGDIVCCELSNAFRLLQCRYAQYVNKKYGRSGSLFRQKAKAKTTLEGNKSYAYTVFTYIHYNPVKAGIVTCSEDWQYSSYNEYANNKGYNICNTILAEELIGFRNMEYIQQVLHIADSSVHS